MGKRTTARTILPEQTIVFENVQHPTHLAKDEHPRALLLHAREQLVEDKHRVLDEVLVGGVRWSRFLKMGHISTC